MPLKPPLRGGEEQRGRGNAAPNTAVPASLSNVSDSGITDSALTLKDAFAGQPPTTQSSKRDDATPKKNCQSRRNCVAVNGRKSWTTPASTIS
jgi:hypothetical protein